MTIKRTRVSRRERIYVEADVGTTEDGIQGEGAGESDTGVVAGAQRKGVARMDSGVDCLIEAGAESSTAAD